VTRQVSKDRVGQTLEIGEHVLLLPRRISSPGLKLCLVNKESSIASRLDRLGRRTRRSHSDGLESSKDNSLVFSNIYDRNDIVEGDAVQGRLGVSFRHFIET
jgi:hypothetical protein